MDLFSLRRPNLSCFFINFRALKILFGVFMRIVIRIVLKQQLRCLDKMKGKTIFTKQYHRWTIFSNSIVSLKLSHFVPGNHENISLPILNLKFHVGKRGISSVL